MGQQETFRLRRFLVAVAGYGEAVELATSRGKALASVWRSDVFEGYSFGDFLKIARCRLDRHQPNPAAITVSGKPAWGLGHNGQYVQFVWPNGEFVLHSHPLDVLPESARPKAYRSVAA